MPVLFFFFSLFSFICFVTRQEQWESTFPRVTWNSDLVRLEFTNANVGVHWIQSYYQVIPPRKYCIYLPDWVFFALGVEIQGWTQTHGTGLDLTARPPTADPNSDPTLMNSTGVFALPPRCIVRSDYCSVLTGRSLRSKPRGHGAELATFDQCYWTCSCVWIDLGCLVLLVPRVFTQITDKGVAAESIDDNKIRLSGPIGVTVSFIFILICDTIIPGIIVSKITPSPK